jgi:hypothetical protein
VTHTVSGRYLAGRATAASINQSGRDSVTLKITTTRVVLRLLDQLAAKGLHGRTRADVADRLLSRELERLIENGHLEVPVEEPGD